MMPIASDAWPSWVAGRLLAGSLQGAMAVSLRVAGVPAIPGDSRIGAGAGMVDRLARAAAVAVGAAIVAGASASRAGAAFAGRSAAQQPKLGRRGDRVVGGRRARSRVPPRLRVRIAARSRPPIGTAA